jgi:HEAT repeat protein
MHLGVAFVLVAAVSGTGGTITEPSSEEQMVRAAGLTTDGSALLDFFHKRTQPKADGDQLLALARKLGDSTAEVRAKSAAELVGWGPLAVPALRHVLNDLDEPLAADHALRCLEWIEGKNRGDLPVAAARLVALRKPAGAAEVLLAYLPFADNLAVVDSIKAALLKLTSPRAQPEAALVHALQDPVPLRRAIAVEVLATNGPPEVLPDVRKLLADPKPQVRLRAALALAERQDEQSIAVLIDLIGELPAAQRKEIEDLLQHLAGEWSPDLGLKGDDEVSRRIRRDAWAAWWKHTDGDTLMAAFRKRTLTPDETGKVQALIAKLADNVFSTRERAGAELVAMGPKVVPLLRLATSSKDREQATRAESCLKQIAKLEDKQKLPTAAARLLALRKPAGATAMLLDFLPFTDDEAMHTEIGKGLKRLAAGKPEPVLLKALEDPLPLRRMVAAEALAGAGDHLPAVRKLLKDPVDAVRLRVAMALTFARDKQAVPALIDLVAELPRGQAWQAEEVLYRLAGAKAPRVSPGDDAAGRKKFRDDWQAWWKEQGEGIDLAQLEAAPAVLGFTLIAEMANNNNMGRVIELDRNGKVRWQLDNVQFPIDAQLLPGNRVLVAEYNANRVTERTFKGEILWQKNNLPGQPVNTQRLSNGNTFIAINPNVLMEVDAAGKVVFNLNVPENVFAGRKTIDGQIVYLSNTGQCIRLDAAGKEIKRFQIPVNYNWTSGLDVTPKGHALVAQIGGNKVIEYDRDGKMVWETTVPGNTIPTRLINGHTLITNYNQAHVVEVDANGRMVWEYRCTPGYRPFRAQGR